MSKYLENVKKYVDSPNETAVEALVAHLGLALQSHDASIVAATDADELARIKTGYCSKTLDLTAEEADAAIAKTCQKMTGDKAKCRVTFYYLLAEASDSMGRLAA
ncbi:DUF2853 family protein [Allorhodopirellula solitaria]|uniref:DUF2853 domain-containing protein n=1 Tax=Allorhodopirellula solitaria TaxID=2527987 RepID=A0A5C5YEW7_9BACT|nr:DUF2853 family protein [Allorhodopirellula solitaria]TWT73041.1 hypothetical protein CA85_15070 [Allorhodopirellula solitaria]